MRALLERLGLRKPRRLVGVQTFTGRAYNPFTEAVVPISATAKLFVDDAGRRSVELSDPALKKEPIIIVWLEKGKTPDGMTVCA